MEFKGTKRLTLSKNKNQVLDDTKVLVIANVNDYGDFTHKYDALLFSKAPDMLEMLEMHIYALDNGSLKFFEKYEFNVSELSGKCRKLIKEATEL